MILTILVKIEPKDLMIWSAFYICIHFLIYLLIFRNIKFFLREKVIFFYHFFSVFTVLIIFGILGAVSQSGLFVAAIGALSLHGIYSLSFLEIWALSEGSYSLIILDRIAGSNGISVGKNQMELQGLGSSKKKKRIKNLQEIGLVTRQGEQFNLTGLGRLALRVLGSFMWLTNMTRQF